MKYSNIVGPVVMFVCVMLLATAGAADAKATKDYKAVLVLPGPINDQSWNATNYSGLLACNEQLGTNIEYIENVQQSDFESTFRNYGERGYDLVIAAGTQFDNAAETIAPLYPDTHYLIVNGAKTNGNNLSGVTIREWESGYLAGVLAGLLTESGIIGEMGGFPNPLMIDTLNGVTAGAKSVNPNFKKAIRAYANSWSDIAKGKEIGVSMIEGGADVLFAYANQAGLGTLMAAQDAGKKFIGFASNQNATDPKMIPGSVIYKYDQLYLFVVGKFIKGELKADVITSGLSEGIIDVMFSESATQNMKDAVATAREGIVSGDILKPEGEE
ncbi:BMP family ABC transporter substrate-binding protein [candidate division KSB3 bacterium]|uniref:BMP family ABC transporter substrate-binding protein n=1 Tax=candidate division KSB3 bacterium TaxID=2044937 RepID=A0A2G6E6A9_9BACT|nr:MAG: BMP family ABC transporter substrate-binding protein [candidate division KSB3 bacterium]PIE29930.1 MAG: BMP family ABC transporter substrate-binding protein [candidate division KSB3 bacterium]